MCGVPASRSSISSRGSRMLKADILEYFPRSPSKPGSHPPPSHRTPASRSAHFNMRKLKYHEQKLLKKVDFLQWKSDQNIREIQVWSVEGGRMKLDSPVLAHPKVRACPCCQLPQPAGTAADIKALLVPQYPLSLKTLGMWGFAFPRPCGESWRKHTPRNQIYVDHSSSCFIMERSSLRPCI